MDLIVSKITRDYIYFFLGLIFGVLAIYLIKKDPRRIANGILIALFMFFSLVGLFGIVIADIDVIGFIIYQNDVKNTILLFSSFLSVFVGIALVINGIRILRIEKMSLSSMLPLIFGSFYIFLPIINFLIILRIELKQTYLLNFLVDVAFLSILYIPSILFVFFIYSFVYAWLPKDINCNFIVVLGACLNKQKIVAPILASRLELAIKIYNKNEVASLIIVSGGKGPGELVPEAVVMKEYLLKRGIPEWDILIEDKSRNTYENMNFSHNLIKSIKKNYKCIFVTSNFHVLRAAIQARAVNLHSHGFGSPTPLYKLPFFFLREYVAVIFKYKKLALSFIVIAIFKSLLTIF